MAQVALDSAAGILDQLLDQRSSCRGFTSEPVPRETLDEIVTAAGRAPSWCNTQPWHVHVLSGAATDELRGRLGAAIRCDPEPRPDFAFPPAYEGVYAERRRRSGWQLYEAVGVERGDRHASSVQMLRNFDFFGAPHVAIVTTSAGLGTYGAVDCGLFVQTLLLAAQARGVAAVAQAALAGQAPIVREFLELEDDRLVLVGVAFGFADTAHPANSYRTERQGLDDLVTHVGLS